MINKYSHIPIAILLTVIFLYPILSNFSTHLPSRADGVFITWTIYTVSKFLALGKNIFNLPFFYPFQNTLAYSDPYIPTALLTLPLLPFTKNLVFIHNFHLVTGSIVMYIASYLLATQLKYSKVAAHFTSLIFTFSAIHLHYVVHLQSYLIAGIPLTFYFILRWQEKEKWQWLALAFGAFLYQMLNSPMAGFFLLFSLVSLVFQKNFLTVVKKHFGLICYYSLLASVLIAVIYLPFIGVSQQFDYVRPIRDAAHFAHSLNRLFEADLLVLYCLLIIFWLSRYKNAVQSILPLKNILIIVAIGAVLMLGPALKIDGETVKVLGIPIPLPYAIFYYVVPGFSAFRDSSRWILVMNFGFSLLAGQLVTKSKLRDWVKILLFGGLILLYFSLGTTKIPLFPIPTKIPKIYETIKNRPEKIIAEFPVFSWRMMPYAYLENDRLLYQTQHEKILYNGVSGFTPPIREKQWDWLWREFPSLETINHLKTQGVELVVIHYNLYDKMNINDFLYSDYRSPSSLQLKQKVDASLDLIVCQEASCIYRFY